MRVQHRPTSRYQGRQTLRKFVSIIGDRREKELALWLSDTLHRALQDAAGVVCELQHGKLGTGLRIDRDLDGTVATMLEGGEGVGEL